ncbi:MAG: HAMP domain-containing histidine kinase [Thermoleophilia bacterium]|nr:HAMP domain-containing histidine kinase [Thermoleophilia bacterium]
MSLRVRLALAIAIISALVAGGISVAVYQRSTTDRVDRARETAARQVRTAASIVRLRLPGGATVTPSGSYVVTSTGGVGDTSIAAGLPPILQARVENAPGRVFSEPVLTGSDPAIYAGTQLASAGAVYVRQSFVADQQELGALQDALIRLTAAASVIGAILGVLVASALSRRLRRSATLARRLAAGDLDARLHPRGRDEIAQLGRALDDMAEALGTTIRELDETAERERRFSADVAHELRTPITGLVAASSLLDDTPEAVMVKERAGALAHLVEDLLEVMRLDAGAETAMTDQFDFVRLVGDVTRDCLPEAEVTLPVTLRVQSDPRRLERIIVNLLENARRYGEAPFAVVLDADTMSLTIRDSGRGFGAFLDRAADRFAMAAVARGGGSGLGLAIAEGQARVLGGTLELHDDGGAVATLRLPPESRVPVGASIVVGGTG